MSSPPNPQSSSTNHPLDHIPRTNASSIFAFTLPLQPGTQPLQHARETTGRSGGRSTSARSRSVAPQTTHSSLSAPPPPVTPPDYLALEDLGTFVRDSVGAVGGVVDNASHSASTATPFASPPSTSPNLVLPLNMAPSSRSRASQTEGGPRPPLSRCSSDRASVELEAKDIEAIDRDVEKDLANIPVLLIAYPVGKALAWALPIRSWIVPRTLPWIGGKEFSLNPCPFNIKEHTLISVMIISSNLYPFAMQIVLVIRKKYGTSIGFLSALCFELASRLLGLSMVAIGQKLVVERPSAIWPTVLVYPTLLNTLHAGMDVPRYRFFLIGSTIAFVYNFLPAIYYNDVWKSGHLPMSSAGAFDRFAQPYNLNRGLTPDLTLNATAYTEYSPLYLTATFSVLYLAAFATIPALFVYFTLQHGPTLLDVMLNKRTQDEDIHARLMRQYNTIPVWWYAVIFVLCFAASMISIKVPDVQTPVWILLLALLLAAVSYPPLVCVFAWSGQSMSLNIFAEIVTGALLPGRPIANMISKAYSIETVGMALFYTEAFKLGHYLKLPPRTVFSGERLVLVTSLDKAVSTTWSSTEANVLGAFCERTHHSIRIGIPARVGKLALHIFHVKCVIKRRNFRWWAKYNYILGAAFDAGTSLSGVVIAAALGIPKGGTLSPDWWGNSVWMDTADAIGVPYLPTDPIQGF
ncbi:hypothetical protein FRC04_010871 [Tulasnella sp. 424]|nr:hypothetical protein FRC04_010871 [Tulasnella sp. 424]